MKNFARIIDLGAAECCVPALWLLDALFDGSHEDQLEAECHKVLATVMHQMELVDEHLEDGVALTLDGPTLDKIYRADAD